MTGPRAPAGPCTHRSGGEFQSTPTASPCESDRFWRVNLLTFDWILAHTEDDHQIPRCVRSGEWNSCLVTVLLSMPVGC